MHLSNLIESNLTTANKISCSTINQIEADKNTECKAIEENRGRQKQAAS